MTFYQELQLNQAGSKSLLKNSKTMKEKLYHAFVYMVKIAVTMVFCFAFVTASSIILGKDNSIVGVVVLLCVMVFRNADLGIHTRHSTWLLALFFVIMTVCPHLANQLSPLPALLIIHLCLINPHWFLAIYCYMDMMCQEKAICFE